MKFKEGDKVEFVVDYGTYKAGDIVTVTSTEECCDQNEGGLVNGKDFFCYFSRVKLVEDDQPWTPKNGEVVKVKDDVADDDDTWLEFKFIGMDLKGRFVCEDNDIEGGCHEAWDQCRQIQPEPTPTEDPQLTAALTENTRLQEELDTLRNKMQELIDKAEKVK